MDRLSAAWDQFERRYNAQRGFTNFEGSGTGRVREYQTGSGDEPTGTIFDNIDNLGSNFLDLESEGIEGLTCKMFFLFLRALVNALGT